MRRFLPLLAILSVTPILQGFVLLGANKATLDVSTQAPVATFVWNGAAPKIEEKDKFQDGQLQDLNDQDFMRELLTFALSRWSQVPGSFLALELAEDPDASQDPEDGVHAIVVEKSDNFSSAAYAAPKIDEDDTSIIKDCDINISDRKTDAKSLAYTLIHELGHCIGLGHPHTNYGSIMGYSRMARDLRLGADDIAGLIYLYPDTDYVDGEPKELVSCGVTLGELGSNVSLWGLAMLMALPLLWGTIGSMAKQGDLNQKTAEYEQGTTELES